MPPFRPVPTVLTAAFPEPIDLDHLVDVVEEELREDGYAHLLRTADTALARDGEGRFLVCVACRDAVPTAREILVRRGAVVEGG